MTESLWLEQLQDHATQLMLVNKRDSQMVLEQQMRCFALADPWRGQLICVHADQSHKAVVTLSADGDVQPLSGLPDDLDWRPCAFSPDGKALLLSGLDVSQNVRGLSVFRVDSTDEAYFELLGITRADDDQIFFAPQFCEDQIGVFVGSGPSTALHYYEWSYVDAPQSSCVQLGFPSVQMSVASGWSRTSDGQSIHVLGDLSSLKRQQFMRVVSGLETATPVGVMVPTLDAAQFSASSTFAYLADSSKLGVFDFESASIVESLPLNHRIVLGLSAPTEQMVSVQYMDGESVCLGQWRRGSQEIKQLSKVSAPVLGWGLLSVDLPHSKTQSYTVEELQRQMEARASAEPQGGASELNEAVGDGQHTDKAAGESEVGGSVSEAIENGTGGAVALHSERADTHSVVRDPAQDFLGWITHAAEHDDPETMLRKLKPFRDSEPVIAQCVQHLQSCLEELSKDEELVLEVIVAIAAAAELRAQAARPLLEQMCATARERLLEHATLPFVEEHFSLAALRALDKPEGRFSLVVVYEEYEQIIQTVTREDVSEEKRNKILKKTSTRYRRALEHVIFDHGKKTQTKASKNTQSSIESVQSSEQSTDSAHQSTERPAESLAAQAYRFKPLAQRFPTGAQPWQPTGASLSNRASSDILRLEDFGPSGDESFQAHTPLHRSPKWVKGLLFSMSGIGGFLALAVLMLGFEYASILIFGGLALGMGSLAMLGNAFKHWVGGIVLFVAGIISLMIAPSTVTLPEAIGPWVFWGPAVVFIGFIAVLLGGQVRASFVQSRLIEDEFD